MSFDKDTRNLLAKTITACRRGLIEDVTDQLRGVFGLHPDGTVLPLDKLMHLSPDQNSAARRLRELLDHYTGGAAGKESDRRKAAYERMTLEISFTVLNRLAALRLCEERGLVVECVQKGMSSDGFQMFERISGGALGPRYDTYRIFLECMFDELALDLGVLFDRMTPQSAVFPTVRCMEDVLAELNKAELKHLWTEDETIGWVYQYFNPPEERKAMREASQVPRNSRELAVRNQFFTPRYVVEFLTDNTLGRIWYEMRKGDTGLKEECHYLVRRPHEVFFAPGEKPLADPETETELSREEMLRKPVHIEHRPKKDPRDLRVLDPACGSGHFLLYAFDLLERIYEEAWADPESPKSEVTGRTLREDFKTLDNLRRTAPQLIVEHNLHGIDIDPRAVQIAALALWLRAQKTWKNLGLKAAERPQVYKSNIVTAETMPGEEDMRREFTAGIKPRVLGQLVDVVFEKMKLAGEAGSLLKIEEEITDAVAEAGKQWREGPKPDLQLLFPGMSDLRFKQQELRFDVKGVTDERFWEQAEDRILEALKEYAERAENGHAIRRRLFAEDAARGFAFIDLCRKRYDTVLMNPPFGLGSKASEKYLNAGYIGSGASEVCASFYSRVVELLHDGSFFGAISSRTFYYLHSLKDWRCKEGFAKSTLRYWVDLGQGILDDAVNETAAYVVSKGRIEKHLSSFGMYHRDNDKEAAMSAFVSNGYGNFFRPLTSFEKLPDKPLCYWVSNSFIRNLSSLKAFGDEIADVQMGLAPRDEFRFSRLWWEVKSNHTGRNRNWVPYAKGGELSPYYSDVELLLGAKNDLEEIKAALNQKYPYLKGNLSWVLHPENSYFQPGLTFGQRTTFLRVSVLPAGGYFSVAGKGIFGHALSNKVLLQLINTPSCQYLVSLRRERLELDPQYQEGDVARMPWPDIPSESAHALEQTGLESAEKVRRIASFDEVDHSFVHLRNYKEVADARAQAQNVIELSEKEADISFSSLLGLDEQDRWFIDREILPRWHSRSTANWYAPADIDRLQYMVGLVFGRWDVRIALDPSLAPKLPDPFDPLPVCPPGMLVGPDGLPAEPNRIVSEEWLRARPDANTLPPEGAVKSPTIHDDTYLLRVSWDGILVDDPGFNGNQPHRDDVVRRVRDVLDLIWKDKAHEIEQEAYDILGVSDLRDYFRKPTGFFQDHLKRYSKSRRKAPIYWPLSTVSGSYTIWLYYHRLTDQTLYAAVNKYVEPKIADIERVIARIEDDLKAASGRDATRLTDRLNETRTFLGELRDQREELLRIAALPYKPDLNDGVIINAAPFHKLFRLRHWAKDTEDCWTKLEKGDYDWAHLAYTIWPDRVGEACKTDRSIAIAHGLEDLCEVEAGKARIKIGRKSKS